MQVYKILNLLTLLISELHQDLICNYFGGEQSSYLSNGFLSLYPNGISIISAGSYQQHIYGFLKFCTPMYVSIETMTYKLRQSFYDLMPHLWLYLNHNFILWYIFHLHFHFLHLISKLPTTSAQRFKLSSNRASNSSKLDL